MSSAMVLFHIDLGVVDDRQITHMGMGTSSRRELRWRRSTMAKPAAAPPPPAVAIGGMRYNNERDSSESNWKVGPFGKAVQISSVSESRNGSLETHRCVSGAKVPVDNRPSPRRFSNPSDGMSALTTSFTAAIAANANNARHERYAAHIPVNKGDSGSGRQSTVSQDSQQRLVIAFYEVEVVNIESFWRNYQLDSYHLPAQLKRLQLRSQVSPSSETFAVVIRDLNYQLDSYHLPAQLKRLQLRSQVSPSSETFAVVIRDLNVIWAMSKHE
ncbi:hypothetical protein OSTOST_06387, partial [Ostertagia ostertagi]